MAGLDDQDVIKAIVIMAEQPDIARVDTGHHVSCHRWRDIEVERA
jgi:hypothetical protein